MFCLNFAPFGGNSFCIVDAIIQYLDFFQYAKNIFDNSSITFSFDKGLGGNMWAVVTYYLLSPFNILLFFFKPEELHSFYDISFVLKSSFAALTMAYYLEKRFEKQLSFLQTVLLACGFGLMEFNIHQARNIMWLDAVYMLPLMLLGIHKLRTNGSIIFLTVTTALAILFNWYSGFVVSMFVGLFSIWEYIVFNDKPFLLKDILKYECKVAAAIILAVGLNAIQLVPTFQALAAGRGHIDGGYFNFHYFGRPLNILQGLTWGSISEIERVALFTGDLVTFCCIAFFLQKNVSKRLLIGGIILVGFIFTMFYWRPILFLFSLLKDPNSYFYRYSYLASFMMIYLSAIFLISRQKCSEWRIESKKLLVLAFALFPTIVFVRQFTRPINAIENVLPSLAVYIIIVLYFNFGDKFKLSKAILVSLLFFGLTYNAYLLMPQMMNKDVYGRQNYVVQQTELVNQLKDFDSSIYRVSQSRPYTYHDPNDIFAKVYSTANHNEGLAYNLRTISSYTSSPINDQLWLLDRLGYKKNGPNFNIINISVLPTDSLLGVKYIFSDIAVDGLTPTNLAVYNNKITYQNDFAFPLAFVCDNISVDDIKYDGNPFTYTNKLYSRLFGKDLKIYNELSYKMTIDSKRKFNFDILSPHLRGAIYGNIGQDNDVAGLLSVDGLWLNQAFAWMGTSAFFVPHSYEQESIHVQLDMERDIDAKLSPYFYIVDENELKKAHDLAYNRAVDFIKFTDHEIKMTVNAKAGEKLFTSIPYEDWHITLNGRPVEAEVTCSCFIGLTLDEGDNLIEMHYSMPKLLSGFIITALSFLCICRICK